MFIPCSALLEVDRCAGSELKLPTFGVIPTTLVFACGPCPLPLTKPPAALPPLVDTGAEILLDGVAPDFMFAAVEAGTNGGCDTVPGCLFSGGAGFNRPSDVWCVAGGMDSKTDFCIVADGIGTVVAAAEEEADATSDVEVSELDKEMAGAPVDEVIDLTAD